MPRPDRSPDPHPVPTQRRVMISALDKRHGRFVLETVLAERGIDMSQPYHKDLQDSDAETDVYVQDLPEHAA